MTQDHSLAVMMFVPGSDQRKIDKIPSLDNAAFILDLEDAVAESAKPEARGKVAAAITRLGSSSPLYVRVNGVDSGHFHDDVEAVVLPGLAGIDLPKVQSPRDIHIADWLIGEFERRRDLPPGSIAIMATIETVMGLTNLHGIATSSPRLRRLCFGAGDFSLDVGLDWPPPSGSLSGTLLHAKTQVILASRQYGLEPPHDGVFPDFRDLDGLRREAEQGRALGFYGKHAIHPAQLNVIREVFTPSASQIAWARQVVTAFDESERNGVAAIHLGGRFIDYPVAARARQVLRATGEGSHDGE